MARGRTRHAPGWSHHTLPTRREVSCPWETGRCSACYGWYVKYLSTVLQLTNVHATDSITFTAVLMGIMRANCVPFPISPRNSPAAVAHLLKETGAMHLVVGAESSMHELAAASLALFTGVHPRVSDMPTHEELYCVAEDNSIFLPLSRPAMSDSAVILHSSGSTSFPKPIYWTQHGILQIAAQGCQSILLPPTHSD